MAATFSVYFLLPSNKDEVEVSVAEEAAEAFLEEEPYFVNYLNETSVSNYNKNLDQGLMLYREPSSRAAVEWFYSHVTGDADISLAILEAADTNDIPLSLAFALAYTESRYNKNAVNRNTNGSTDRGLFQLNNNSFPGLTEADFFNPTTSARYGMSHLRFCLNSAGNQISALAMYNAGTTKVRSNKTPQSTLNYVGIIINYQQMLDRIFEEEVVSYYEPSFLSNVTVAMTAKK